MAVDVHVVTRFHPDEIQVPGDPDRLRAAADRLQDLVSEVTDVGKRLRQADAPKESRGPTVRAMSRVAGTLGQVLEADAEQLSDLSELVRRQADLLTDAHTTLEDTRRRWRQARQELRTEIDSINQAAERERAERRAERERERERRRAERERDGKGGRDDRDHHDDDAHDERRDIEPPTEAGQLIKAMDQQVLDQFEGPLRRLAGLEFTDRHGAVAMTSGKVEQAAERYRQSLHAIIEDLVEAMRQVNRVDGQLVEKLPRHEKTLLASVSSPTAGDAAPDPLRLSRPDDIASVGEELQECARALNELGQRLPDIRLSIREGRMTPEDEVQGSMNGFQRTWNQHFDEIREDLHHARKASSEIATQLRELDERGAREVRRSFRAQ